MSRRSPFAVDIGGDEVSELTYGTFWRFVVLLTDMSDWLVCGDLLTCICRHVDRASYKNMTSIGGQPRVTTHDTLISRR